MRLWAFFVVFFIFNSAQQKTQKEYNKIEAIALCINLKTKT